MIFTAIVYMVVNLLLLKGVAGLLRVSVGMIELLIGTMIAGGYVFTCLITKNSMLCSVPVYLLTVFLTAFVSFGAKKRCWTGVFAFVLLYLSLGGVCIRRQAVLSLVIGAAGILIAAYIASSHRGREYVHVNLQYDDREFEFYALLDTGNLLKDPVSGCPVLVVSADIARKITGLSIQQLRLPIDSINVLPGSRLIPYKTIGQSGSFLLGLYVPHLKVGQWQGSGVIALSPETFGSKGTYQALAGGYV